MLGQDRWATPKYKSEVLSLVHMYLVYTVSQPKILSHILLPFGVKDERTMYEIQQCLFMIKYECT